MAAELSNPRFGDICVHSAFGPRFSSDEYATDGNVACLRTTDIDSNGRIDFASMPLARLNLEKLKSHVLKRGDLVITRTGAYLGKAAVFTDYKLPVLPGAFSIRFRLDREVAEPTYVRYYFNSSVGQQSIQSVAMGSVQPNLNIPNLHSLTVPLPPLPTQRAIARILGTLDDKIELNRRMNATLEAMAQALFESWFVDFDPVRAKRDGRKPAGMDDETAALFPDSFEESELGPIPTGWRVGSIYEVSEVIYGAPFASNQFNVSRRGKPLIRIRDLADESPGVWTTEVHPKGYTVQPGDIIVGMDGEFRSYVWGGLPAWLNQRVCVFVPKTGFSTAFVRNCIIRPLAEVEATETATTVIHLGKNDIDRFKVTMPLPAVHKVFARVCQKWYDQIVAIKQQSRTLAALRDALLPKLLSGELSAKAAESLFGQET